MKSLPDSKGAASSAALGLLLVGAALLITFMAIFLFSSSPGDESSLAGGDENFENQPVDAPLADGRDLAVTRDRSSLGPESAHDPVTIEGFLSLDGAPLAGVTIQAIDGQTEELPPTLVRLLLSTPVAHTEAGKELERFAHQGDGLPAETAAECVTGADGSFSLALIPRDAVRFRLDHDFFYLPGHLAGPHEWLHDRGGSMLPTFPGKIAAELGALVQGTIRDGAKEPVEGAVVDCFRAPERPGRLFSFFPGRDALDIETRTAQSSSRGAFKLRGVPPGHGLVVNVADHRFVDAMSEPVEAAAGKMAVVDFQLHPGTTIDCAVHGPGGKPLEGAQVFLERKLDDAHAQVLPQLKMMIDAMGHLIVAKGRTDRAGAQRFTKVGPGEYSITAAYSGLVQTRTDEPVVITGADGARSVRIDLDWGLACAGRVVDSGDRPVAGALVRLLPHVGRGKFGLFGDALRLSEDSQKKSWTDGKGTFRITGLEPEVSYNLTVTAEGFAVLPKEEVKGGDESITLVMKKLGQIEGRAIAAGSSRPVTAFSVWIAPAGDRTADFDAIPLNALGYGGRSSPPRPAAERPVEVGPSSLKDAYSEVMQKIVRQSYLQGSRLTNRIDEIRHGEGRFSLRDITPGTYRLCLSAERFAPAVTEKITIGSEAAADDLVFALERGASISGRVTARGGPVRKAAVEIRFAEDFETTPELTLGLASVDRALTDETGHFQIGRLPAGEYVLHVSHDEHPDKKSDVLFLAPGQALGGISIALRPGGAISGIAYDAQGEPIADREIICRKERDWRSTKRERTDSGGAFEFKGLAPGTHTVNITSGSRSQFSRRGGPDRVEVTLSEGEFVEIVLREAPPSGVSVSGTITDCGRPLDNGHLTISSSDTHQSGSTMIDESGKYTLDGVSPGTNTFTVRFAVDGASEMVTQTFEIPDLPAAVVDFALPGGRIGGRVVDAVTGLPVGKVRVELRMKDQAQGRSFYGGSKKSLSAQDGSFSLNKLTAGTYTVSARPSSEIAGAAGTGYCGATIDGVVVEEAQSVDGLKIALSTGGALRLIVVDEGQSPVKSAGVTASFEGDSKSSRPPSIRKQTNAEGEAFLNGMEPGAWSLSVTARETARAVLEGIVVKRGQIEVVNITLEKGFDVSVRLNDADGAPVNNARLSLRDAQGRYVRISSTGGRRPSGDAGDPDANLYRLGYLKSGRYTLSVRWSSVRGEASLSVNGAGEIALTVREK